MISTNADLEGLGVWDEALRGRGAAYRPLIEGYSVRSNGVGIQSGMSR